MKDAESQTLKRTFRYNVYTVIFCDKRDVNRNHRVVLMVSTTSTPFHNNHHRSRKPIR